MSHVHTDADTVPKVQTHTATHRHGYESLSERDADTFTSEMTGHLRGTSQSLA